MKIGFTGTQEGMTEPQALSLIKYGRHRVSQAAMLREVLSFHHGLCVGADEQAHHVFRMYTPRVQIIGHPPLINTKMMAYDPGDFDGLWPAKDYLERNHEIVDATDELFAAPKTQGEEKRSGTWATVRWARMRSKQVTIFWPDGTVTGRPL